MSFWLDFENTSNKFKQSYFKGFIDISGGGLNVRNDASLNIYGSSSNNPIPTFSIKSDKMYIYSKDASGIVDISNDRLIYLKNVESDIQDSLTNVSNKISAFDSTSTLDASINNHLFVGRDAYINGRLFVNEYSSSAVITTFNSLLVNEDMSLNGKMYVSGDASFNQRLFVSDSIFANSDITINGKLNINTDSFYVGGTPFSISNIASDASINGKLNVLEDVSLNKRLFVGGDALLKNTYVEGDLLVMSAITAIGDVSFGSRLFITPDSFYVGGTPFSISNIASDASINGKLNVL